MTSPVQHARINASASSWRRPRSLRSTPNARCSGGSTAPRPTAGRKRPPESASRVAISFARMIGFRPGRTNTEVPSFIRVVRPAAMARAIIGSGVSAPIRSDIHKESNPSDSQRSTIDAKRSGLAAPDRVPRPIPTRTLIALVMSHPRTSLSLCPLLQQRPLDRGLAAYSRRPCTPPVPPLVASFDLAHQSPCASPFCRWQVAQTQKRRQRQRRSRPRQLS
ncbi:unannotated protein [freshwater metagenome]|uniref:Unannotated protein n=1 Tax=freshwater metagenome TaxID=449393 RepID=A0A6J7VPS6_9ZZZZ